MGKSIAELRKIVNFCRKNGILSYRNQDFEIKLSRQALKLPRPRIKNEHHDVKAPTAEDLLFWSSAPVGMGEFNG